MGAIKNRCVIICASPTANRDHILTKITDDDFIICADGGADWLSGSGITPDMIIGDMDSSAQYKDFSDSEMIVLNTMKDDTDTMHCVVKALEMGYNEFLLLGATGGRTDHTLCNLSVLLYLKNHHAHGTISDEYSEITILFNGTNKITDIKNKTVSVLPFACSQAALTYSGLLYPMDHKTVTAEFPFTISNKALEDTVYITVHSGTALLIISE